MTGCFITFEGIDGTGKSTQAKLLCEALERMGLPYVHTREPGGTDVGEQLRTILLQKDAEPLAPLTEVLLLAAARAQHVTQVIRPALESGAVVVCERYVDSSLAYQGATGVPLSDIKSVNAVATGGLTPDLTLLFDLDPEEAMVEQSRDRIEERSAAYHRRVREGFLRIHREEPQRVVLIPVLRRTPQEIHTDVLEAVRPLLATAL